MATFASLSETASTNDDDLLLVSQSGVDYKQTRASLVASVSNARWLETQGYTLGSEVIGSDDNKYYALSGSYAQDPTTDDGTNWQYIDRNPQVENFFKTNQNWNIVGKEGNPIPSASARIYASGEEIASGIIADGAVTISRYSSGLVSGTGSYYREYDGVDVTDGFYGVKLATGVISQTGVTISLVGGNTRVTVNLSQAGSHKFVGLSEGVGKWPDISDSESSLLLDSLDVRGNAIVEVDLTVENNLTVEGSSTLDELTVIGVSTVDGSDVITDKGHSISESGYQRLSSGLIMQWGVINGVGTEVFPTPFSNACFGVTITVNDYWSSADGNDIAITDITTNDFTWYAEGGNRKHFYYAIGN